MTVVSVALQDWKGPRQARLDQLLDAHRRIGGTGAGRRWRTEQLNWSLVLRLAGEFQGFARALHDEAVDYFTLQVGALNTPVSNVVRARMVDTRNLDSGNASPGKLGSDFGRLGIQLWTALEGRYTRAKVWNHTLEALNTARNGIAHDDQTKMAKLTADGWNLGQLETIRRFHRATDSLAGGMDTVLSTHLERLFGGGKPW